MFDLNNVLIYCFVLQIIGLILGGHWPFWFQL